MKNRQFDTEKLAASIKVLVKAAGLRNSEVCKRRSYESLLLLQDS